MSLYFGVDTSNYRTSAALFSSDTGEFKNSGRILSVPSGTIGLRQSEALFQHVLTLPEMVKGLDAGAGSKIRAIGVSTRPRREEGSYMPCFLAGQGLAQSLAHILDVPCYEFSHQEGHLAAAAFSANAMKLLESPFLAWHLSGGTTELLLVEPDKNNMIKAKCIGGTEDLAAGQLVDRAGKILDLPFPAGPYLEEISLGCQTVKPFSPKVNSFSFSLSGVENKVIDMHKNGADKALIARFTIETILRAVEKATENAVKKYRLPLLCAGGVMSNKLIQARMSEKFGAYLAAPQLSGDNAVGVSLLAALKNGENLCRII